MNYAIHIWDKLHNLRNISEQCSRVNTEAVVFSMSIDIKYILVALRRVTTIAGALNLGRKHFEVDY